jgi:5-methylcytosine-specific restriction endonuclease McrA
MDLPSRPCPKPGCANLNCTEHSSARLYDQARRRARHADPERAPGLGRYNTVRWRRLREIVLDRDPVCKACDDRAASEADHIVPIAKGGDVWSLDNLQGLCARCHAVKTRREGVGA